MSAEAWNKITQTQELFKNIIAPLKQHLNINFGYMIVLNDGRYYQIIEDLDCLKKWVSNVETSHIFCARNMTTCFDEPYNFTIWPEEQKDPAMQIYKEHGMWNGITVSTVNKDYAELYWFTKKDLQDGWHKFFIRNKQIWLEFIKCFSVYKNKLNICNNSQDDLDIKSGNFFKFSQGFKTQIRNSEYADKELAIINRTRSAIQSGIIFTAQLQEKTKLSLREIEILGMLCRGYPHKIIGQKLFLSHNTIKFHVKNIKEKTGICCKIDLIKLYENRSY